MSLTIRKREQVRNTPVLTFIAVACIPLFLAFAGGLSTGRLSSLQTKAAAGQLEQLQARLDSLETNHKMLNRLTDTLNILKEQFKKDMDDLDKKMTDAFATEDPLAISRWQFTDREMVFGNWNTSLSNLQLQFKASTTPNFHNQIQNQFQLFEALISPYRILLQSNFLKRQDLLNQGQKDGLKSLMDSLTNQSKALSDQQQMTQLTKEVESLKSQLDACEKKSSTSSQTNPANIAKIKQEVSAIRNEIIPQMNTGILGKPNEMKQLKDKLTGIASSIAESANAIQ